jgi:hypothetical protein
MSSEKKWASLDSLKGWTVANEPAALVEQAHLKRHPQHTNYIPGSEVKRLSEAESEAYDHLNLKMHDELRRVSQEHFAHTPVPQELHQKDPYFTPFTYQNYDWYGPTYECPIAVITDYISADLLQKFQSLLQGEYQDWCILVLASDTPDFENTYEIGIFSDQIIVPQAAADSMGASRK